MSEKVTVTISDETAEELRETINARRDAMRRQKEQLRQGKRAGSRVAELESHDTDTETAVRASIKYTMDDLK